MPHLHAHKAASAEFSFVPLSCLVVGGGAFKFNFLVMIIIIKEGYDKIYTL